MKCVLVGALLVAACVFPPARAAENPQRLFWDIKQEARGLRKARLVVNVDRPISALVFSSMTPQEGCTVYLDSALAAAVTNSQLAVMLGHELAHCVLGHHQRVRDGHDAEAIKVKWDCEYEADALSLKLIRRLDLDTSAAFVQVLGFFPDDPLHPPREARVRALQGGAREFVPSLPDPSVVAKQ